MFHFNRRCAALLKGGIELNGGRGFHYTHRSIALTHIPSTSYGARQDEDSTKHGIKPQHSFDASPPGRNSIGQARMYRVTTKRENVTLVMALGSVALTAKAIEYGIRGHKEWKESQPLEQPADSAAQEAHEDESKKKPDADSTSSTNIFSQLFSFSVGSKYYEGGFEEKMTRREAALILGVRESSSSKRIKEAHRRNLILNHPDTGGSTYLTLKVNEAKELLLKGKE